jgi:hypothetical protein
MSTQMSYRSSCKAYFRNVFATRREWSSIVDLKIAAQDQRSNAVVIGEAGTLQGGDGYVTHRTACIQSARRLGGPYRAETGFALPAGQVCTNECRMRSVSHRPSQRNIHVLIGPSCIHLRLRLLYALGCSCAKQSHVPRT